MKRFAWLAVVCLMCVSGAKAQEGGNLQVGGFADYFRSGATGTNMFGLGGRVGYAVRDNLMIEGEMAYDFSRTFNNSFTQTTFPGVSYINSNVSTLHGLFGPRLLIGSHRIRPFVELKAGLIDYRFGPLASGFTSYSQQIANLRNQSVNGALLAGGGLDGRIGPIGMRFDVGDEVYFNSGAHNGLKVAIGPYITF